MPEEKKQWFAMRAYKKEKQAEEAIIADAENLGILKDAEQNAKLFFEALLAQVGFDNIIINYN